MLFPSSCFCCTIAALVSILQLLLTNHQCCAFVPFPPPRGHHSTFVLADSISGSFESIANEFESCTTAEIQQKLVQKGIEFKGQQQDQKDITNANFLQSPFEKVPGCVANVYVQTSLKKKPDEKDDIDSYDIEFQGNADALLSCGLLALLTDALASTDSLTEILQTDPYTIAEQIGIRRALSPGRNDGLANMLQVIQGQINGLLQKEGMQDEKSIDITPLYVDTTKRNEGVQVKLNLGDGQQKRDFGSKEAPKVALLLSGGVDSSVALCLLLQQGFNVTAFYLKIWLEDELSHLGQCPWEDDYNVCRQVCEQAGVPLESISLQEEYRDRVISYTIHEAQRGRTPNPDILCNSQVKFGCFYDAIAERDFDYVASGHYARLEPSLAERIEENSGEPVFLHRAPDPVKDQSYFLCALTQEQLQKVIFPIGHLEKVEVRQLAEQFGLPNRHRPDSQGLCFLGKVKFDEFLGAYLGERPGDIIDASTGDNLGRHKGVWYHTVGQRKGIGKVLNPLATSRGPWYVVAKDPDQDIVFCSNQYDEEIFAAARSEVTVEDIQWIAGHPPQDLDRVDGSRRFDMKIRHGPKIVSGMLTLTTEEGSTGDVKLDRKDGGLAPGQYVVFYDGDKCLGGGVISERHWAKFLKQRQPLCNSTMVPP